jgi:tetratricopeptide (TPR) repeat protein
MGRHRDLLLAWLERCPEEPDFMRLFFPAHGVTLDGHPVAGLEPPATEELRAKIRDRFRTESLPRAVASSTHAAARSTLLERVSGGKPFCLILPDPNASTRHWNHSPGSSREDWITEALSARMPVVGLVRPGTFGTGPADKLAVSAVDFPMVLEMLAEEARFVVLSLSKLAWRVTTEVSVLEQLKRSDSTLVVLPEAGLGGDAELRQHLGSIGWMTDLPSLRAAGPAALLKRLDQSEPRPPGPTPDRTLLGMLAWWARSYVRAGDHRSAVLSAVNTLGNLPDLTDESLRLTAARLRVTLADALVPLPGDNAALAVSSLDAAGQLVAGLQGDEAQAFSADLLLRKANLAALRGTAAEALRLCGEARAAFAAREDTANVALTHLTEGTIRRREQDLDRARRSYESALGIYRELKDQAMVDEVQGWLASSQEPAAERPGAGEVLGAGETPPPYFGFFAPAVDGTILALITTSTPGDPEREAMSEGALAEQRFIALDTLEGAATGEAHDRAVELVNEAVATGRPFGLYLRNFALGATATWGGVDRYGKPQVFTAGYDTDRRMQQIVAAQSEGGLPFVAIANRAIYGEPIPSLVVSNQDWEAVAELLIEHAGAIAVFFLTSTPGVSREFDLIRLARAQDRTLIVVAEEDPRKSGFEGLFKAMAKIEPDAGPPERTPPPDDFPHQVTLAEGQAGADAVTAALEALARRAAPTSTWELLPLPAPDRPPPEALAEAHARAVAEYEAGCAHIEAKQGVAAEDAFVRSIGFSHWARDPLGRAMGFLQLGSVERYLLKYPNEAVSCYFHALDLFRSLADTSETAATAYGPTRKALSEYLVELGDERRARWVFDHYELPPR